MPRWRINRLLCFHIGSLNKGNEQAQKVSLSGCSLAYWFSAPERAMGLGCTSSSSTKRRGGVGGRIVKVKRVCALYWPISVSQFSSGLPAVPWKHAAAIDSNIHIVSSSPIIHPFCVLKNIHIPPRCHAILFSFWRIFTASFVFEDSLPDCFPSGLSPHDMALRKYHTFPHDIYVCQFCCSSETIFPYFFFRQCYC